MTGGESAPGLVLCASPRAKGNSETAARTYAQAVAARGGASSLLRLREYHIEPCLACGVCSTGEDCPLIVRDDSAPIFSALLTAPTLFIASPIYFYHLPARFKGLIDRAQAYYMLRERQAATEPSRPATVCLIAGRTQGERLFEGALLTLKYFLIPFNFHISRTILLRGLDGPTALADTPAALAEIAAE